MPGLQERFSEKKQHNTASGKRSIRLQMRNGGNPILSSSMRAERYGSLLDADMTVEQTGKTAVVRIEVPPVDRLGSFDAQVEAVRAGLQAAKRLLDRSPDIKLP